MADGFCHRYIFAVSGKTDLRAAVQSGEDDPQFGGERVGVCASSFTARHGDGFQGAVSGGVCKSVFVEGCFFFSDERDGCKILYLYEQLRSFYGRTCLLSDGLSAGGPEGDDMRKGDRAQHGGHGFGILVSAYPEQRQGSQETLYGKTGFLRGDASLQGICGFRKQSVRALRQAAGVDSGKAGGGETCRKSTAGKAISGSISQHREKERAAGGGGTARNGSGGTGTEKSFPESGGGVLR